MAADGRVEISVNLDNKEAEKKLSDLRRSIEKTAKSIESTGGKKAAITEQLEQARKEAAATAKEIEELNAQKIENEATLSGRTGDVSLEAFEARKQAQAEITYQLKEQEKLQASQNSTIAKLEENERAVTAQLEQQTSRLEQQKAEAGEVERVIASQASSAMPQLAASAEAISKSMKKGFKNILKWGIGIRSVFILVRRLRSAVVEGVKAFAESDAETQASINGLKASLQTLKISWGAAFAPILNAVAPILQKLIGWLTQVANAIQMFFAVLGGKTTYKAVKANEALADSYGGAGSAAEEAEKQILGFDEIDKLSDNKSGGGGGGGGGSGLDAVEEAIDAMSLGARLAMAVKDVLFDWSDITPEQIAEKAIAGLTALSGMFLGAMIGGVPGAVIGLLAGLAFGILLDATIFNFDGKLDKNEIFDMLALAIGAVGGGIIGFILGGPLGAAIGITIGLVIGFGSILLEKSGVFEKIDEFFASVKNYFKSKIDSWKAVLPNDAAGISFAIIMGLIEGLWDGANLLWNSIKDFVRRIIIGGSNEELGIHSPSTVFAEIGKNIVAGLIQGIVNKWQEFRAIFSSLWNGLKQWWGNLSLGAFDLKLPHISYSLVTVPILGTIPDPRTLHIDWYARGGIVDGATLIGAGEAGKEAIIPLERHTEWIRLVADSLIDRITSNNRLADYISGRHLPALASGQVVPPRSLSSSGSVFTDGDIERLVSGIKAAFTNDGGGYDEQPIKLYLDGRQVAEAVTRHQRNMNRR